MSSSSTRPIIPAPTAAEHELRAALSIAEGPHPPILRTVATNGQGIDELADLLAALPLPRHAGAPPEHVSDAIAFYAAPGLRVVPVGRADCDYEGRVLNGPVAGAPSHLYVLPEPGSQNLLELSQEKSS